MMGTASGPCERRAAIPHPSPPCDGGRVGGGIGNPSAFFTRRPAFFPANPRLLPGGCVRMMGASGAAARRSTPGKSCVRR
jgi:hypothetical protein